MEQTQCPFDTVCDACDHIDNCTHLKEKEKRMEKTLNNENTKDAKANASDVIVFGNPDVWVLICKASSKKGKWMKSTKAMQAGNGCFVQVTTQQGDQVSEALDFAPNMKIKKDKNGNLYLG